MGGSQEQILLIYILVLSPWSVCLCRGVQGALSCVLGNGLRTSLWDRPAGGMGLLSSQPGWGTPQLWAQSLSSGTLQTLTLCDFLPLVSLGREQPPVPVAVGLSLCSVLCLVLFPGTPETGSRVPPKEKELRLS